jgi:MOSC domain-containing protein YiiM
MTGSGTLVSIHIARAAGAPLESLPGAELVAGRGIVGDRYFEGTGAFSPAVQDPDHELTLIDLDEIERFNAVVGAALEPAAFRRNLVTRGIDLGALVDREFSIGAVRLRGVRICEPCATLAGRTHKLVVKHMLHRCGLRAGIVSSGRIQVGDPIALAVG